MYNATQLRHFLHESVRGLARRKISGSVAVIIMGSALLTLALFSLVTINMDRFIHSIRGEIDMTVFLLDEVHPEDLSRLEGDLVSTVGVRAVRYVSADDALERDGLDDLPEVGEHRVHERRVEGVGDRQLTGADAALGKHRRHLEGTRLDTGDHHRCRPVHRGDGQVVVVSSGG